MGPYVGQTVLFYPLAEDIPPHVGLVVSVLTYPAKHVRLRHWGADGLESNSPVAQDVPYWDGTGPQPTGWYCKATNPL